MAYATRLAREDQLRQIATAREVTAMLATPARPMDLDPAPGSDGPPGTMTAVGIPADADPLAKSASPEIDHWERGEAAHPNVDLDGQQDTMSDDVAGRDHGMMCPTVAPTGDRPPRRRRGRPPKAR